MAKSKKNQNIDRDINRYGIHMNEESFALQVMYGRNYLENNVTFNVKIYKINIIESKTHKLYGQAKAKDKVFFAPVEIKAMVNVADNEQRNYGDNQGGIAREDTGPITVDVYLEELKEKQLEIDRGDIIEYNFSGDKPRYYEVESANNVTDSTSQTIANFRPYWKRIIGIPVKSDTIIFLKGDSLR